MTTGLVYHPDYLLHDTGKGHPERPQRLTWILHGLEKASLMERLEQHTPDAASLEAVYRVHPSSYVAWLEQMAAKAPIALDPDTIISSASYRAALLAAGGAIAAVDAVCTGRWSQALVLPRPPGHHASVARAMGFCLLNNVAIAARHAQSYHGLRRIAILDWDVHHGNGTQDIFYEDPSVFYCSVHEYPYYPGTGAATERGAGAGTGFTLNCPLPSGTGDAEYLRVMDAVVMPALRAFRPELLLISAGFDGHRDDPLASMQLTETGFAGLTERATALAAECCGGRLVSVLEGGYHPRALPASVVAHVQALTRATVNGGAHVTA